MENLVSIPNDMVFHRKRNQNDIWHINTAYCYIYSRQNKCKYSQLILSSSRIGNEELSQSRSERELMIGTLNPYSWYALNLIIFPIVTHYKYIHIHIQYQFVQCMPDWQKQRRYFSLIICLQRYAICMLRCMHKQNRLAKPNIDTGYR